MALVSDCWKSTARIGYGWRRGKKWAGRDYDTARLLSMVGDRQAWRGEALAAMQLLSNLAARPTCHDQSSLSSVVADVQMLVQELRALKGVVSDHEVAIIDMEDDLRRCQPSGVGTGTSECHDTVSHTPVARDVSDLFAGDGLDADFESLVACGAGALGDCDNVGAAHSFDSAGADAAAGGPDSKSGFCHWGRNWC